MEFADRQEPSQATLEQLSHERAAEHDEHYWIKAATDDRRNGYHESALRHYSRALEMDKSLVAGWVGQVQMLIALAEYPEAELWSRKALELFKNNADLLAVRGQALCRMGDLKNAQASCDAAINQQGSFSIPWIARGELMLARKENIDDYCFDKAVQLDPDWLVLLEIGTIYLHYDRATKALQRIRLAVEKTPDHAYCWYCQGVCELALGLTGPAEKSFNHCLQLMPKHSLALRSLNELKQNRRVLLNFFRRLFRFS
ncbi:MAG TPA: tetratricopeptide repeat protein [Phycisphaerae bacterium]|nr:tetratricopeptide repeat protein [Phycisphaerae bacterium]